MAIRAVGVEDGAHGRADRRQAATAERSAPAARRWRSTAATGETKAWTATREAGHRRSSRR
jgi:hypothetical protein